MAARLTEANEIFIAEYVKTGNATEAYRKSRPNSRASKKTQSENACRLLIDSNIAARIEELRAATIAATGMNIERWTKELNRLGTADIRKIMHPDGRMKLPHELDDDTAAAIASFKIDIDGTIEYKFWPKAQPLDMLGKHIGAYERDNKQKTDPLASLLAQLSGNVVGPSPDQNNDDDQGD